MEKAQAKGDVGEEELRALEMDVTGKVGLKMTTVPNQSTNCFIAHARFMARRASGGRPSSSRGLLLLI